MPKLLATALRDQAMALIFLCSMLQLHFISSYFLQHSGYLWWPNHANWLEVFSGLEVSKGIRLELDYTCDDFSRGVLDLNPPALFYSFLTFQKAANYLPLLSSWN